jgi:ectoine hydroxylase-related dioxygenase (phytanoyl-CoA dioxygenase family)
MLKTDDRIRFIDEGYLVVPAALSSSEVSGLRLSMDQIFARPATEPGDYDSRPTLGSVRFDVFSRNPQLQWLLARDTVVNAARALLGDDFLILPEMSAHRGGYGDWHKDTTQQEKAGRTFHWSPTFAMVELAFYLQDNGTAGGGLDVVPGSHRKPDRWVAERGLAERVGASLERRRLLPRRRGISIPSRAGDLVIFDFRLDHKASWPRRGAPSSGQPKYALFVACSANNSHAREYVDYIRTRPEYVYLRDHVYPTEMRGIVEASGANLLSL